MSGHMPEGTGREPYPDAVIEALVQYLIGRHYPGVDLSHPDDLALVRRVLFYEAREIAEIVRPLVRAEGASF